VQHCYESLDEVKVSNIHCSLPTYSIRLVIVESKKGRQALGLCLVSLCRLFPIASLFFVCLQVVCQEALLHFPPGD